MLVERLRILQRGAAARGPRLELGLVGKRPKLDGLVAQAALALGPRALRARPVNLEKRATAVTQAQRGVPRSASASASS
jgi:hypothetical protein